MRSARPLYQCFPSVLCVGKETTVTIVPRDTSRVFRPEWEYAIGIDGIMDDQLDYQNHSPTDHSYEIANGCLLFTFTPAKEQEYFVRLVALGKEFKLPLYAVEEDLYHLRPLKGDFHTHTYYSDGNNGITMTPADYREEGFDFFTLTDHNRRFTSVLAQELYKDVPLGMHIILGEEVHSPGSAVHIVHAGGKGSVCARYIHNPEEYQAEVKAIEAELPHIPEQYRTRVAMAHWACRKIHEKEGLAIFAHPFWQPDHYNVIPELSRIFFEEKIFDAFELMGGCRTKDSNMQLALWQEQAFRGNPISVVGSSDSHNHDSDGNIFAHRFTLVFAKENTTEAILEAVRNGFSLAGEQPKGRLDDVRFYGSSLRLIAFAHFLYENYFPETWRLCFGEGVLMRRYAQGEDVAAVLGALAPTVETFWKRFYGLLEAPVLGFKELAFLDRALEIQRTEGPISKGSKLYIYGTNQRRE